MLDLYVAGTSPLHRLGAGWKLLALVFSGSFLFSLDDMFITAAALCATFALYAAAGLSWDHVWRQLYAGLSVFVLIFLAQLLFGDWTAGVLIVLRFAVLFLLAGLLTLTTRSSEIIQSIEAAMRPLAHIGLDPAKIGLAVSLMLRFIPVMVRVVEEVREAQKTRGLERNPIALVMPALIRTIKMSEDISDAIDARGF